MKNLIGGLVIGSLAITACATSINSAIERPDAKQIIKKDLIAGPTAYTMPKSCISTDKLAIARGAFIFHNLNGEKIKTNPPKGLAKKTADGKPKQYGNCVACHNIEGAKGAGNIGPDLTDYKENFVDSGARDMQFVYQKIADPRIDNENTHMTVNLTTKLFNEREICDIASYVVAKKK